MSDKQLLHLVFGGQVKDPQTMEFVDLNKVDVVGIYPNFDEARRAWQDVSQRNVDDAMTRYVVVHLHRLMEPHED